MANDDVVIVFRELFSQLENVAKRVEGLTKTRWQIESVRPDGLMSACVVKRIEQQVSGVMQARFIECYQALHNVLLDGWVASQHGAQPVRPADLEYAGVRFDSAAEMLDTLNNQILPGLFEELPISLTLDVAIDDALGQFVSLPTIGTQQSALIPARNGAAHADDFRSVNWSGTPYSFTPKQAACIKILWEHWERGTSDVGDQTILELADLSSSRLDAVFRNCAAWGTIIVAGLTKGTHRLEKPTA